MHVIIDLRNRFGSVRDQGSRPTCLAFATSDTHAALRPAWTLLSCEYLFNRSIKRMSGDPGQGTTFAAVLD
ncbi:MAG: C1 family peptidase, partial [Nitrospiraceae bacterium]